jgi:hypothetical protein
MSTEHQALTVLQKLASPQPTITATGLLAPSGGAISNQGTPGAATVSYKLVSKSATGAKRSLATANITTTSANATLNGSNFNRITWTDPTAIGSGTIEVYRTAGGPDQGYIGVVAAGVQSFDDTGIAGGVSPILPVATTRKYKVVALGVDDREAVAGTEGSSAVGPESLSSSTPMHGSFTAVTGATGYLVYRTDTILTKGLIATLAAGVTTFDDTGTAGDGNDPNTTDETGVGDSVDIGHLNDVVVMVGGTFVATLKIQVLIDGTNWIDWDSAKTAPGCLATIRQARAIRPVMTAYTSGTVLAGYSGELSTDREPHFH